MKLADHEIKELWRATMLIKVFNLGICKSLDCGENPALCAGKPCQAYKNIEQLINKTVQNERERILKLAKQFIRFEIDSHFEKIEEEISEKCAIGLEKMIEEVRSEV